MYESMTKALLETMGDGGHVFADYGATEVLPATEMSGRDALAETFAKTAAGEGICVGKPFSGVEVKIIRIVEGPIASEEQIEVLPPGEIGEIVAKGAHVSPAYYRDEPNTTKHKIAAKDGGFFHRIGDAGYADRDGRIWYLGRVGQRVKLANGSLFSLQCEPIFDAHPDVRRSGLVGVPGKGGEVPVICVEVRTDRTVDLESLHKQLLERAAANPRSACIRHVLFPERLPVDPRHNSKIERSKLAAWAKERISTGEKAPLVPAPNVKAAS
jgi:acyl-CoA synthetase (AMP-forming)/AMP-acid ligase II